MKLYLTVLFFAIVSFSCKNDKTERSDVFGKWQIDNLVSLESASYPKDNGFSPLIEFKSDGSFLLNLDVNTGDGSFTFEGDNSIRISQPGCTKNCCDSEFSKKFLLMVPQVTSFSIEKGTLKLHIPSWGWYELTRISD